VNVLQDVPYFRPLFLYFVLAISEGVSSTLKLTEVDLLDIADGLARMFAAYDKMGIYSFNMNSFTRAAGTDEKARFHLLFSPRTFFNQALGTPELTFRGNCILRARDLHFRERSAPC
jgi:hypothetical protein